MIILSSLDDLQTVEVGVGHILAVGLVVDEGGHGERAQDAVEAVEDVLAALERGNDGGEVVLQHVAESDDGVQIVLVVALQEDVDLGKK